MNPINTVKDQLKVKTIKNKKKTFKNTDINSLQNLKFALRKIIAEK